jgi:hypothetical protein
VSATLPLPKRNKSSFAVGYRRAANISENAQFENDPVGWIRHVLKEHPWSKQVDIATSVNEERYTSVQSAHDTGKSYISSRLAAWWLDTRPDPFVVTTAPTWKQVNSILWREMRKAHRKGGLKGRINLDAEWYMGSDELVGFGRKPADYDQAAFQGIHALNVLVIVDEACGVPKTIFDAVDALATNKRARVLAIGNPDDPTAHFETICRPGSGWHNIKISAFDTPAFTDEEVPEYLYDYLVSPEWVEERKKRWGIKSPTYISKVQGEFPDISDDTLLHPRMLRAAQDRETPVLSGVPSFGCDIARYGDDENAVYRAVGGHVRFVETWGQTDLMSTAAKIYHLTNAEVEAQSATVKIDVVGLGAGVYDRMRELGSRVIAFNSSETPDDPERFLNRRAEAYWYVRELAERGELDLAGFGEDEDLIAELGAIKWTIKGKGKIAMVSKDDMRKEGMPSPNRADAVAMALWHAAYIGMPDLSHLGTEEGSITGDLLEREM